MEEGGCCDFKGAVQQTDGMMEHGVRLHAEWWEGVEEGEGEVWRSGERGVGG